ncbi:MAG: glycosyltransferase [Paracoccaceae bacterium]|nr:glycosyltransferase [Paracoccaceae bacterium]
MLLQSSVIFFVFLSTFAASLFILLTKPLHIRFTAKGHTASARQSSHRNPTPRVGGLSILLGCIVGVLLLAGPDTTHVAILLGVSTVLVFLGGLGEDIGLNISTRTRLVLSFASALSAGLLFNYWIPRLGIPGLEFLTSHLVISALLTILVSAGVSHSFNLIDGLNGLAIGVSILIGLGLGGIAFSVEDYTLSSICWILVASLVGILILNFPFGKIFLGDAGAYSIGHIYFWIGILILNRNPEVQPFAILLIFFWPVADMLFSIYRRYRNSRPIDQPDRLHYHQLVMRAAELLFLSRKYRQLTNPLATCIILPLAAAPVVTALFIWPSNKHAIFACIAYFALFAASYIFGLILAKRYAKTRFRKFDNLAVSAYLKRWVN